MSTFRLFKIDPANTGAAELIDSHDREKNMARSVFRRWPVAACLPGKHGDSIVLMVWETVDDAKQKRTPVALVRTFPDSNLGFKQQLWSTPVSA